jgi:hypothetical protein
VHPWTMDTNTKRILRSLVSMNRYWIPLSKYTSSVYSVSILWLIQIALKLHPKCLIQCQISTQTGREIIPRDDLKDQRSLNGLQI